MATSIVDPTQRQIDQILRATKRAAADAWRLRELVAELYANAGAAGLHRLAAQSHYTYGTLRQWVQDHQRFDPAIRAQYPLFTPEFFRAADRGRRAFGAGQPEASMEYWLGLAVQEQLTRNALRARIRERLDRIPPAAMPSPQDRLIQLHRRAQAVAQDIEQRADQFNTLYKPYAFFSLSLTRVPYYPI